MSVAAAVKSQTPRRRKNRSAAFDPSTVSALYELLQGDRKEVKVFSKALNAEVLFINPVLASEEASYNMPVFTTRELAFVLSLSEEELQRYYYLKMRLV